MKKIAALLLALALMGASGCDALTKNLFKNFAFENVQGAFATDDDGESYFIVKANVHNKSGFSVTLTDDIYLTATQNGNSLSETSGISAGGSWLSFYSDQSEPFDAGETRSLMYAFAISSMSGKFEVRVNEYGNSKYQSFSWDNKALSKVTLKGTEDLPSAPDTGDTGGDNTGKSGGNDDPVDPAPPETNGSGYTIGNFRAGYTTDRDGDTYFILVFAFRNTSGHALTPSSCVTCEVYADQEYLFTETEIVTDAGRYEFYDYYSDLDPGAQKDIYLMYQFDYIAADRIYVNVFDNTTFQDAFNSYVNVLDLTFIPLN